jgi:hypothetical protein
LVVYAMRTAAVFTLATSTTLLRAGHVVCLADPAERAARRGRRRRAKTDNSDCDLMLGRLLRGELRVWRRDDGWPRLLA